MKLLEEIRKDISDRLKSAQEAHRNERNADLPDVRSKECAWGKMVAYAHCLKLFNDIEYSTVKLALKKIFQESGNDNLSMYMKYENRLRKKDEEISYMWDNIISRINNDSKAPDLLQLCEEMKEALRIAKIDGMSWQNRKSRIDSALNKYEELMSSSV